MTASVLQQTTLAQVKAGNRNRGGFTFVELVIVITVIAALAAIGFPVFRSVKKNSDVSATQSMIQAVATAMSTYQLKTWTWEIKPANNSVTPPTPAEMKTYHLWDLNHFNSNGAEIPDIKMGMPNDAPGVAKYFSIDGYTPGSKSFHEYNNKTPEQRFNDAATNTEKPGPTALPDKERLWDGNFPPKVIKSGYTGFLNMVAPTIHKKFIRKDGRLIDAWEEPLRIRYQARIFGTESFGIWSSGYDKWDQTFRGDTLGQAVWTDINTGGDDLRSWK